MQALDKMESEWESVDMEILSYKETGTYIMKIGEEVGQQLDDHIVMTQAMSFSPYKKPFEMRIATWENKLRITQDVMEEWWVGHGGVAGGSKWCLLVRVPASMNSVCMYGRRSCHLDLTAQDGVPALLALPGAHLQL